MPLGAAFESLKNANGTPVSPDLDHNTLLSAISRNLSTGSLCRTRNLSHSPSLSSSLALFSTFAVLLIPLKKKGVLPPPGTLTSANPLNRVICVKYSSIGQGPYPVLIYANACVPKAEPHCFEPYPTAFVVRRTPQAGRRVPSGVRRKRRPRSRRLAGIAEDLV